MKLEQSLINQILLRVEESNHSVHDQEFICEKYSADVIAYHLNFLVKENLIESRKTQYIDEKYPTYQITSLTCSGHKYLQSIKPQSLLKYTKNIINNTEIEFSVGPIKFKPSKILKSKTNNLFD